MPRLPPAPSRSRYIPLWLKHSGNGKVTLYGTAPDFLFPSLRNHGTSRSGLTPSCRRSSVRLLSGLGSQERLSAGTPSGTRWRPTCVPGSGCEDGSGTARHANSRITLDLYTQAVSSEKVGANAEVVEMMLPTSRRHLQHPLAPSEEVKVAVRLLSCSFCSVYGGHSRIRTYDFHRVNRLTKGISYLLQRTRAASCFHFLDADFPIYGATRCPVRSSSGLASIGCRPTRNCLYESLLWAASRSLALCQRSTIRK